MATTIITKNGSGAPLAGDLQVGELAIDLTNKKLYSKEYSLYSFLFSSVSFFWRIVIVTQRWSP